MELKKRILLKSLIIGIIGGVFLNYIFPVILSGVCYLYWFFYASKYLGWKMEGALANCRFDLRLDILNLILSITFIGCIVLIILFFKYKKELKN